MRVAVIGANGQLGSDLCRIIPAKDLIPLTHSDIEIIDLSSVRNILQSNKPDIIINTASFVRVDDCETEVDIAFRVNAFGARNVAVVAQELGAKLVHLSTDYVFGGEVGLSRRPYTEFDNPVPVNTYGKSKLAGENFTKHLCNRYFIVRASALFGTEGSRGKNGNFVETILRLAEEKNELKVVNDQIFSPTYTLDLAKKIAQLMITDCYSIYHITNRGFCSWYDFAVEILRLAGLKTMVVPVTSQQYPQQARRPQYSVLDNYCLRLMGFDDMRHWKEALADYMRRKGRLKA